MNGKLPFLTETLTSFEEMLLYVKYFEDLLSVIFFFSVKPKTCVLYLLNYANYNIVFSFFVSIVIGLFVQWRFLSSVQDFTELFEADPAESFNLVSQKGKYLVFAVMSCSLSPCLTCWGASSHVRSVLAYCRVCGECQTFYHIRATSEMKRGGAAKTALTVFE